MDFPAGGDAGRFDRPSARIGRLADGATEPPAGAMCRAIEHWVVELRARRTAAADNHDSRPHLRWVRRTRR